MPYVGGVRGYSNWELSADRANASRRELVAGGMDDGKVLRVVGLADSVPFDRDDRADPANRRISIVVMNKRAERAARGETAAEVHDRAEAAETMQRAAAAPAVRAPAPAAATAE
jgi:chemotaxis protein MotB